MAWERYCSDIEQYAKRKLKSVREVALSYRGVGVEQVGQRGGETRDRLDDRVCNMFRTCNRSRRIRGPKKKEKKNKHEFDS